MKVIGFDHFVLTVESIERTVAFYCNVLGMTAEQFGPQRRWALTFGAHKINLHEKGSEFDPKAAVALPGTADLCFLVDDGSAVPATLASCGVEPMMGPVPRTGARGPMLSYYLRDPDQNLVELSWYVDGTRVAS